jgi:hypothetical protein
MLSKPSGTLVSQHIDMQSESAVPDVAIEGATLSRTRSCIRSGVLRWYVSMGFVNTEPNLSFWSEAVVESWGVESRGVCQHGQ